MLLYGHAQFFVFFQLDPLLACKIQADDWITKFHKPKNEAIVGMDIYHTLSVCDQA